MKLKMTLILLFTLFNSFSFADSRIKTAADVDLSRFLGTWYRISSNPIIFEPKCSCARQILGLTEENLVSVYNSCNKKNVSGKLVEIRGVAKPINNSTSKLSVDFGLPWKGSYWIVAVDESYRYAVVSDKNGYSLYIMSKTPELSDELYQEALQKAKASNVNIGRLVYQGQAGCSYPN